MSEDLFIAKRTRLLKSIRMQFFSKKASQAFPLRYLFSKTIIWSYKLVANAQVVLFTAQLRKLIEIVHETSTDSSETIPWLITFTEKIESKRQAFYWIKRQWWKANIEVNFSWNSWTWILSNKFYWTFNKNPILAEHITAKV